MSGHSKWSTIKRKKEKNRQPARKGFYQNWQRDQRGGKGRWSGSCCKRKIARFDFESKANNVPNDNIDRIIKKASSEGDKNDYETIFYEGYGPCGVAVIVEALTDNRNRTAGDLRHYFDKFGGNLGQNGCVSFMFEQKGLIVIENTGIDEEKIMEDCMEAGAARL